MLTSGRPVPGTDHGRQRGMKVLLCGYAINACRDDGSHWEGTELKTYLCFSGCWTIHALSCYSVTYYASREVKDDFCNSFQKPMSYSTHTRTHARTHAHTQFIRICMCNSCIPQAMHRGVLLSPCMVLLTYF